MSQVEDREVPGHSRDGQMMARGQVTTRDRAAPTLGFVETPAELDIVEMW